MERVGRPTPMSVVSVVGGAPVSDSAGMIAMPSPLLTIESTVPSSSAWTVALGIQSCSDHQLRVYEEQFSAQSTSGSERGSG
ncbi:hypothetical protein M877_21865 [Streptomyces niveus NCIMB 11891]|nr:hypothetical protein M877_21865 [Streptomyces niveus NCIMB 11891]